MASLPTPPSAIAERAAMRLGFLLLTLAATASCGDGSSASAGRAEARDSAGVRIVEASAPASPVYFATVQPQPTLTIGEGVEGDEAYLLSAVLDAVRLDDGRILILDETPSHQIRVFDADGRHMAYWGGAGGGPGEFGFPPYELFRDPSGGVVVPELSAVRVSRFAADGSFISRAVMRYGRSVDRNERARSGSCCQFREVLADGSWLVAYPEEGIVAGTGLRRGERPLERFSPEGESLGEFVAYPGGLWRDGGSADRPVTVLLTGGLATAVHGDEVFIGNGAEFVVDVFTTAGDHVRSLRLNRTPPAFDGELRRAYIERMVGSVRSMQGDDAAARLRPDIERNMPEQLPAFSEILVDPAGHLWLLSASVPGAGDRPRTATVLDRDGNFLGDVVLPAGLRPRQAGDDWLLGVVQDELDVSRVVVHAIISPTS